MLRRALFSILEASTTLAADDAPLALRRAHTSRNVTIKSKSGRRDVGPLYPAISPPCHACTPACAICICLTPIDRQAPAIEDQAPVDAVSMPRLINNRHEITWLVIYGSLQHHLQIPSMKLCIWKTRSCHPTNSLALFPSVEAKAKEITDGQGALSKDNTTTPHCTVASNHRTERTRASRPDLRLSQGNIAHGSTSVHKDSMSLTSLRVLYLRRRNVYAPLHCAASTL